jgi:hypothetical protein
LSLQVSRLHEALVDEEWCGCSPEHARLLLIELIDASMLPSVASLLAASAHWCELRLMSAPPTVLRRSSRQSSLCASGRTSPDDSAEDEDEEDETASEEAAALARPVPPTVSFERSAAAEEVPPLDVPKVAPAADAENVNPNSPTGRRAGEKGKSPPYELSPIHTKSPTHAEPDSPPVLMVCGDSLRNADDFSKLTPRPMLRRTYLHREAKNKSPFGHLESPSPSEMDRNCQLGSPESPEMDRNAIIDDGVDADLASSVISKLLF